MKFTFTPEMTGSVSMRADDELGSRGDSPFPIVRFYTWPGYAISVGRNQDPGKRLDLESCGRDGLEVVRRPTGGKELLHGNDICYSVIWPSAGTKEPDAATGIFRLISEILAASLGRFGLDVNLEASNGRGGGSRGPCFAQTDRGEIAVCGRKLVASAQRVYPNAILQQGSMPLFRPNVDLADYLLRFDRRRIRQALAGNTAFFFELTGETISLSSIVDVFRGEFENRLESEWQRGEGKTGEIKRYAGKTE
jgi:lipoate-protein ligase A